MTKKKKPTGPTIKEVHRSGEILIPGGMGGVVPFAKPKRRRKPSSTEEYDSVKELLEMISALSEGVVQKVLELTQRLNH